MEPATSVYKSSSPLTGEGVSLWTGVHPPHTCRLLASRIKQTLLSTNLVYLFTFQQWAVRSHFWLEGYQLDEEISTIPATDGKYSLSTHLPSFFPQHNHLEVRTQGFKPCNVSLPLPFSFLPHKHTLNSGSYYLPTKLLQLLLNQSSRSLLSSFPKLLSTSPENYF